MSSSSSNFGAFATPLPACDVWGNIRLGTSAVATTLVNGSGISAVQRTATGLHGISFSNPDRFGGGAYVFLVTPEYASSTVGPFVVSGVKVGGVTAPGLSSGFVLSTYGFQTPAAAGGFTINGPLDISANTVWANVAAFSFKTTRDLYDPYVANLIKDSEDLNSSSWFNSISGTALAVGIETNIEPNPITGEVNAHRLTFDIVGATTGTANFSFRQQNVVFTSDLGRGVTGANGLYTWSLWAKSGGVGQTLSVRSVDDNSYTDITLTPDWRRYSGTKQIANNATTQMVGVQIGVRGGFGGAATTPKVSAYIWGVQVESGSLASPYTKTGSTVPVFGDQDAKKRFVPGASGYGVTGATYTSSITALNSVRTPTAYGTIVIPPFPGTSTPLIAYTEGASNISGISFGSNSVVDVFFSKPLKDANYCVILSAELQPAGNNPDYATVEEYPIWFVDRTYKTVNGFRVTSLRQSSSTNNWTPQSVHYQLGLMEKLHFMVFGGGTYGQA